MSKIHRIVCTVIFLADYCNNIDRVHELHFTHTHKDILDGIVFCYRKGVFVVSALMSPFCMTYNMSPLRNNWQITDTSKILIHLLRPPHSSKIKQGSCSVLGT